MMTVKWLIEKYDTDVEPLILEVNNQNIENKVVKYNPWDRKTSDHFPKEDCVIFYGTLDYARQLQQETLWVPGTYCNFNNLNCNVYYSYWGKYLLNSDYKMLPFMELKRQCNSIYYDFGREYNKIFMRPNSGSKVFTGQVVDKDEFDNVFKEFEEYYNTILDNMIVVVSCYRPIEIEWRFVVTDRKVITGSQYIKWDNVDVKEGYDDGAKKLADKIASEKWQPERTYTLDICKTHNSENYYLLEANSFSCAGLYKCDMQTVVKEVSKTALKEWQDYYEFRI